MKRIASFFATTALVCGFAFAFTACQQKEEFEAPSNEVVFSAATSYTNDTETRTIYSGQEFSVGNQPTERIDWVANTDKIRVRNMDTQNQNEAVYTVGAPTAASEKSVASVTADGAKLTWGSGSTNTFRAAYPSTVTFSNDKFQATIPATQSQSETHTGKNGSTVSNPTMNQYAYMVAEVTANNGTDVVLPFKPAMTAFEFYMGIDVPNATVTSFEMSSTSTALTGVWKWNGGNSFECPTFSAGTNDKITVNFSPAASITPQNPLRFTVFALPQNLQNVTLKFVFSSGKTVTLPISGKTFVGGKKYRITTPNLNWVYKIEEIDDQTFYGHNTVDDIPFIVKSYRYNPADPSVKEAVPWHLEYSTTGTVGSYSTSNSNPDYRLHSGSAATGNGVNTSSYSTGEPRAADIYRANSNHDIDNPSAGQAARDALAHATPRGTSSAPFDLSKHPVYGNIDGPEGNMNTANCYVVSAPGYYKFPCVYGNAILNGQDNKSAYDPYGSNAPLENHWDWVWDDASGPDKTDHNVYMTEHFRNVINEPISTPYVLGDFTTVTNVDAVIVWQDTDTGKEIIKYGTDDLKVVNSNSPTSAYIQFYIDPANIKQGNVVIALRGAPNGESKKILWSWHIWISERNLTPISSRDFMPVNLGWVDLTNAAVDKYTDRINYYKVVQDPQESGVTGDTEDFWIKQIGDIEQIKSNVGGNPFYQWGRKDPITAQAATRTSDAYSSELSAYGPTYVFTFMNSVPFYNNTNSWKSLHQSSYSTGIEEPYKPVADPSTKSWINGQFYPPLSRFAHLDFGYDENSNLVTNPVAVWPAGTPWNVTGTDHHHDGAPLRKVASNVSNLWNAYAYDSDDFGGNNKYKTVYDPCPPGFCVPTLDSFYGITGTENTTAKGIDFNVGGTTVFMPFCGARVFTQQGTTTSFEVNTWTSSGFYWTDVPSRVGHSNNYTGHHDHIVGYWWFQFAKALRISTGNIISYVPEDNHWGAETGTPHDNQTQRKGFDDVRGNAFSIRPIADPKYTAPSPAPSPSPSASIGSFGNSGEIPE